MSDYRKDTNQKEKKIERNKNNYSDIGLGRKRQDYIIVFLKYLDKAFCCCNSSMYKIAFIFILEQNTS